MSQYIDGLVEERRNSIANALELHLSYTNPSVSEQQLLKLMDWYNIIGYDC